MIFLFIKKKSLSRIQFIVDRYDNLINRYVSCKFYLILETLPDTNKPLRLNLSKKINKKKPNEFCITSFFYKYFLFCH